MTLQVKYKKLENDCFNLLTVDPNPPHDINHFSRFLRLENTLRATPSDNVYNYGVASCCAVQESPCQGWGREFEPRFPLQHPRGVPQNVGIPCLFKSGRRLPGGGNTKAT